MDMERRDAIRGAYRLTGGNGFYDGMFSLLRQAAQDGFIRADVMDLLTVSDDSETLLDALTKQVEAAEK